MYRGVPKSDIATVTIHTPTPREQQIQKLYSQREIKNKRRLSTLSFQLASPDAPDENIKFGKFAVNYTGSCRANKLFRGEMHGIGKNMTQGSNGKYFFFLSVFSKKIYIIQINNFHQEIFNITNFIICRLMLRKY
jgi:hypothetical protein